jgi:eukaryotic-like serine/threonine-protein kinase
MPSSQGSDYVEGIPKPGEVIAGKYRVDRLLGAGGMGAVVAATHLVLGQTVAVKFLLAEIAHNTNSLARFQREAQAAAMIQSDHVARVSDVGTLDNGTPYMVMEFLEGEDLSEALQRGPLPVPFAVRCVLEASEALAEAHKMGIVHRDLKPANLFLAQRPDGTARVKVLDFGISKMSTGPGANLTKTSALMGSPVYMAPEQMESAKNVDARSDIWALGTILFEALTGVIPFAGDTLPEICAKILTCEAPSLLQARPDAPPGLAEIIARSLRKKPAERFQNLAEMTDLLVPFGDADAPKSAAVVRRVLGMGGPPASAIATGQHAALGNATVAGGPGQLLHGAMSTGTAGTSGPYLAQPAAGFPQQPAGPPYTPTAAGLGPQPQAQATGPYAPLGPPPAPGSYPSQAAMTAGGYPAAGGQSYPGPIGPGATTGMGQASMAIAGAAGAVPWAAQTGGGPAATAGRAMALGAQTAPPFSQTMGGAPARKSRAGLVAAVVGACLLLGLAGVFLVLRGHDESPAPTTTAGEVQGATVSGETPSSTPSAEPTPADTGTAEATPSGSAAASTSAAPSAKGMTSPVARPTGTPSAKSTATVKNRNGDKYF